MNTQADTYASVGGTDPSTITDPGEFMDSMIGAAKGAIRSEREYLTFMASKRIADTTSKMVGVFAKCILYGVALLVASVGAAIWVGKLLGDIVLGFGLVAGFYLLVAIVFGALWKGTLGKNFTLTLINGFHGH